ncbi:MAG: diaminopropionate ammonia-lyase [Oscillospiraceae bacterium]|nr:diaminopropionate ammonia-lyase [Oscillospiraceae bacterium]
MNYPCGIRALRFESDNPNKSDVSAFGSSCAEKTLAFHKSFPEYSVTPLAKLENLARELKVGGIYVKDESYRFGLNAFKVLGGSYAIGCYIASHLGMEEMSFDSLVSEETKAKLGGITFVTATDGNHGRGVAWTANRLGQKSVVYMPKGTAKERLDNILALGSDASITDMVYDDAVRLSQKMAEEKGWVVVQDTSWDGYEEIPHKIMEGYVTMAAEAKEQLGEVKPTHIFLQAGVGSMAAAICAYFVSVCGEDKPIITVLEPTTADCFYKTALANDGALHAAEGDMNSMMAGLCCGEVCPLAWEILRDYGEFFVTVPDYVAANGMRSLAKPLGADSAVISGESGASTFGFVAELLSNPELAELKKAMGIDENSHILCFSTEGDTDRENYRRIVCG